MRFQVSPCPITPDAEDQDRTVVRVANLPRLRFTRSVNANIQIDTANVSRSTQGTQWKNGGEVHWVEKITL